MRSFGRLLRQYLPPASDARGHIHPLYEEVLFARQLQPHEPMQFHNSMAVTSALSTSHKLCTTIVFVLHSCTGL